MIEINSGERPDHTLGSERIEADRKVFFLDLKENQRGRFLKITEDVGGHRDTIMIPERAFEEFILAFGKLAHRERGDDEIG